ncbi:holothin acyltransferase-like [Glandiceps talaboti]
MAQCVRVRSLFQFGLLKQVRSYMLLGTTSTSTTIRTSMATPAPTYQTSTRPLSGSPTLYSNQVTSNIHVRIARKEDSKIVSDWMNTDGWGYTPDYIETLRQVNPEGFFVASKGDEVVGCGYAFNHTDELCSFGLAFTKPGHRKQGIHTKLIEERLKYAGDRNKGAYTVNEHRKQITLQIGFKCIGFEIKDMRGQVSHSILASRDIVPPAITILPINEVSFDSVIEYDGNINSFQRAEFLKIWCKGKNVSTFVAVKEGGVVVGYINVRPLQEDFAILPWYADDVFIAESLLLTLLKALPDNCTVRVHVPSSNKAGLDLAKKYQLNKVFCTLIRQYTKRDVTVPVEKIFCISTPEVMPA